MINIPASKGVLKRQLIKYHHKLSHHNRVHIIAHHLVKKLDNLNLLPEHNRCVDIGSGDMKLVSIIDSIKPHWNWRCLDIHPARGEGGQWDRYEFFNGRNIPYGDKHFDISLLADVLHHAEDIPALLQEAKRVSRYIVIKDHFEYGFYSNTMLKAMDIFGNWAYDVKVPGKYFTRKSFAELCQRTGLEVVDMEIGMDLYQHLPVLNAILKSDWHFTAVLKSK
ncbi:methyltransferase domain-containing protein [Chitinophaga tropicalis]|uniref:Methyltransferase domain-containing protein n=1 Tax=Chitinophaga tropicalis TaxID=2683588 RepID=A0A7K1U7L0_9BACT|nr:methyltransferase domain-containing protein [Chitinophaga tropicalis]MVT10005.1 methyltransferase domain-containing protein [Chitinophaga tropicalis]